MATPGKQNRSFSLRLKIVVISLLSLVVTTACSLLRLRSTSRPDIMCYKAVNPPETPTPQVMCYEMVVPTETPTPQVVCYDMVVLTETPTPPMSPLPTATPTPTPEARRLLLDELLAEGRLPQAAVWVLNEASGSS